MSKEQGYISVIETVAALGFIYLLVSSILLDLKDTSIEIDGSKRISVIEKRIALQMAIGSENSIETVAPWINEAKIWKTSLGPVEIAGNLAIDRRFNIRDRDYIAVQTTFK